MAPKQTCTKYQYVVTASGTKIFPVDEPAPKDEESPADYNTGGYLPIKVNDTFSGNRYNVVRKLGSVNLIHLLLLILAHFVSSSHQMGSFFHGVARQGCIVRCARHLSSFPS